MADVKLKDVANSHGWNFERAYGAVRAMMPLYFHITLSGSEIMLREKAIPQLTAIMNSEDTVNADDEGCIVYVTNHTLADVQSALLSVARTINADVSKIPVSSDAAALGIDDSTADIEVVMSNSAERWRFAVFVTDGKNGSCKVNFYPGGHNAAQRMVSGAIDMASGEYSNVAKLGKGRDKASEMCYELFAKLNRVSVPATDGCYIATAVYGSYYAPPVMTLRSWRDETLEKSRRGRLFIKVYYSISPTIVKLFGKKVWFNRFFKGRLDKFVEKLEQNDKY